MVRVCKFHEITHFPFLGFGRVLISVPLWLLCNLSALHSELLPNSLCGVIKVWSQRTAARG